MKQFVFIAFVVVITIAASNAAEKYTNRFDNVDVDQILNNDRILNNYIKCLLEKGPCTQEGRELKSKSILILFVKHPLFGGRCTAFVSIYC